jgi:hypothetical protein
VAGGAGSIDTPPSAIDTRFRSMNYEDRDIFGMYRGSADDGPGPGLMGADTLIGNDVRNGDGDELGELKEIMLDIRSGRVSYAVLSFGGFLGMGEKLFAVPWSALTLDTMNRRFVLNVEQERLKGAPGFDKDDWPDMADPAWSDEIHAYYGIQPHRDELRPPPE